MTDRRLLIMAVFAVLLIAGGALNRAVGHDIYTLWTQPDNGFSCCSGEQHGGECRPIAGAWLDDEGDWWVRVDGRPLQIPRQKTLPRQPDGRCHICEQHGYVRCFVPCDPKS